MCSRPEVGSRDAMQLLSVSYVLIQTTADTCGNKYTDHISSHVTCVLDGQSNKLLLESTSFNRKT